MTTQTSNDLIQRLAYKYQESIHRQRDAQKEMVQLSTSIADRIAAMDVTDPDGKDLSSTFWIRIDSERLTEAIAKIEKEREYRGHLQTMIAAIDATEWQTAIDQWAAFAN